MANALYKMKYLRSMANSKLPERADLTWQDDTYGIYFVEDADNTLIWKTTDEGETSSEAEDVTENVERAYHDKTNHLVYFLTASGAGSVKAYKLDLSDDSKTQIGAEWAAAGGIEYYSGDIFFYNSTLYALIMHLDGSGATVGGVKMYKWVDPNWVLQDTVEGSVTAMVRCSYMTIVGTKGYACVTEFSGAPANATDLARYDFTADSFIANYTIGLYSVENNYLSLNDDNDDLIFFTLKQNADSNYYLLRYSITDNTSTVLAIRTISLMLSRNNTSSVPHEREKGAELAKDGNNLSRIYEITPKRKGIIQYQTIERDANIKAFTDDYLFFDDYAIYKFTDIVNLLSSCKYRYGIFPVPGVGSLAIFPDDAHYFHKGDSVKLYINSVLAFFGRIRDDDSVDLNRVSKFYFEVYFNEWLTSPYIKSYDGDNTGEKLQDILDNHTDFCYRSSSITATTTDYDYNLTRAAAAISRLARVLDRQVVYSEPDGKVYSKDYNGLTATGASWDIATDGGIFPMLVPRTKPKSVYYKGESRVTRVDCYGDTGIEGYEPDSGSRPSSTELSTGIIPLRPYRDNHLKEDATADAIADTLYNIFTTETIFLGNIVQGKDTFYQPGKTVSVSDTGEWSFSATTLMILYYDYDFIQDRYEMILTNNIIFPEEWFNLQIGTTGQQVSQNTTAIRDAKGDIATIQGNYDKSVWRTPEATDSDFEEGGGNTDFSTIGDVANTWYDLDLSSILPSGASWVYFYIAVEDGAANSKVEFRQNGQAANIQKVRALTQVANQSIPNAYWVAVDSNRKIEFRCVPKASDFTIIYFTVLGWKV